MSDFEFGIGLFPTGPLAETVRVAKLAEELGYAHVWIGDSPLLWREAYVSLTAVALSTTRVKIGCGVTNPLTRDLSVTASAHATLAEHAPGRVTLGLGLGDSAVRTLGAKPATLAALERAVQQLRQPGLKYPNAALPIYIAATGPKMLQLAGRIADGVIVMVGVADAHIARARELIESGARSAGRRQDDIDIVLRVPCAVSDSAPAKEAVKAHVARALSLPLPYPLDDAEQKVLADIRAAYDYSQHLDSHARHAAVIPDWTIDRYTVAGTVEHCRSELARLRKAGIRHVSAVPYAAPGESREDTLRAFAKAAASVKTVV